MVLGLIYWNTQDLFSLKNRDLIILFALAAL